MKLGRVSVEHDFSLLTLEVVRHFAILVDVIWRFCTQIEKTFGSTSNRYRSEGLCYLGCNAIWVATLLVGDKTSAYVVMASGPHEIKIKWSSLIARFMGANMGPIWGRQDPGGPHVGLMNLAIWVYFDGLVQERHNSSALAMVLRLSCTNPSIWWHTIQQKR